MGQSPGMPDRIETGDSLLMDDYLIAQIVRIHGRMQHADIGADAGQVDFGNAAFTQPDIQIGTAEG